MVSTAHLIRRLFESIIKVPLPSGNWLQLSNEPDKHCDLWSLFDASGDEIGYISVWARDGRGRPVQVPSIDDSQLYTHARGKGHGREAMQGLTIHYGHLRSSASGATSPAASKAWQAINATELTPDQRKYKSHLQNSDWMLTANNVDWRVNESKPKVYDGRPSLEALEKRIGKARMPEVRTAILKGRRYWLRVFVLPNGYPGLAWEEVNGKVQQVEHPKFIIYRTRGDGKIDGSQTALDTELVFED